MKSTYSKPTLTKMGAVTVKTEGYYTGTRMEIFSFRDAPTGGN